MEEPFEWIVEFRYKGQDKDSPNIWWRIPKDRLPNPYPTELGVVPINVLLLYK
jgi:molybdate transport system ATP-binding protein